mmetsp:Transcript_8578/g.35755  ORF Transcript_8578/g.35755 Transcript_8578/m.35755 type:complete len:265 (+) Transcript_8578:1186-1980(+)
MLQPRRRRRGSGPRQRGGDRGCAAGNAEAGDCLACSERAEPEPRRLPADGGLPVVPRGRPRARPPPGPPAGRRPRGSGGGLQPGDGRPPAAVRPQLGGAAGGRRHDLPQGAARRKAAEARGLRALPCSRLAPPAAAAASALPPLGAPREAGRRARAVDAGTAVAGRGPVLRGRHPAAGAGPARGGRAHDWHRPQRAGHLLQRGHPRGRPPLLHSAALRWRLRPAHGHGPGGGQQPLRRCPLCALAAARGSQGGAAARRQPGRRS